MLNSLSSLGKYTFSCDIYSKNGVTLRLYDGNQNMISSVISPSGQTSIVLSGTFSNTLNGNYVRFILYGEGNEAYIDNLKFINS